jgi:hypothetical protein
MSARAAAIKLKINIRTAQDWVQKDQTDIDYASNCVFIDESAFHINLKRTYEQHYISSLLISIYIR